MSNFERVNTELREARRSEGSPYQSTQQFYTQNQFQSRLDFGQTCSSQLLHSSKSIRTIDLVFEVSAVTPVTGAPAWPEGIDNIISNLQMTYGGNLVTSLSGGQIAVINKKRASISGLASIEASTLMNQTLAQRTAATGAARTFVVHLPLPCDDQPIPYSVCASDIIIQISINALNNVLEAGTGTGTITNAYLNVGFLPSPTDVQSVDEAIAAVVATRPNGLDTLYRDNYFMQFPLLAGSTTYTAQLNQLRNSVKEVLFYMVPTASITTVGDYKPTDYQPIDTFQFTFQGNNVFSMQPIDADVSRWRMLAYSGVLNYVSENMYGFVPDGGTEGDDFKPIETPYGGGLFIGPANNGAPELTLTFPALGSNHTLFVFVEAWNALRYDAVANGKVNFMKVLA